MEEIVKEKIENKNINSNINSKESWEALIKGGSYSIDFFD